MRLTLWISSLLLVIILGGAFLYIKFSPPLEIGTVASSDDKQITLIGIGNKGFSKIKLTEVLVSAAETPMDVKIQESNLIDGFALTDNYNSKEGKGITFKNINEVNIEMGTSPASDFEKSDEGTASKQDVIYGLHIINERPIFDVQINYKYLGITFTEEVKIK